MPAIRSASKADWVAIQDLLRSSKLPLEGAEKHLDAYVVAVQNGSVVATAGIEVYAEVGLLRSVAVAQAQQGRGLGRLVVEAVIQKAIKRRLVALYLLTNTAADYFAGRGFLHVRRADAPTLLLESEEFRGACPASATLMARVLAPG